MELATQYKSNLTTMTSSIISWLDPGGGGGPGGHRTPPPPPPPHTHGTAIYKIDVDIFGMAIPFFLGGGGTGEGRGCQKKSIPWGKLRAPLLRTNDIYAIS